MDLGVWVVERGLGCQRRGTGVDGHAAGVGVEDEAVIDVRFFFAEGEGFVCCYAWIFLNGACGNAAGVDDLVFVCCEGDFCADDGGGVAENEVAVGRLIYVVK